MRIKQGLNIPVVGCPEQAIHDGPPIRHVALCGPDYQGLRPRMMVQEGDRVSCGQPMFVHKHHPGVPYCAPGAGEVIAIHRGARRALHSVVLRLEDEECGKRLYQPMTHTRIRRLERVEAAGRLREAGLWTAFRTRPFSAVPAANSVPRAIFVTAIDTRPLAPDPCVVTAGQTEAFADGLSVLMSLTPGSVYLCTAPEWEWSAPGDRRIRHVRFEGPHPAGLPGTHIHYLDPVGAGRQVWHVGYQDVIAIGRLFSEGVLDFSRVVALGGSGIHQPRLVRSRLGASIPELVGRYMQDEDGSRFISGSVLGGRAAHAGLAYLGRYHEQVTVIPEGGDRHLFGWTGIFPWRYSATRTFLRRLGQRRKYNLTTAQNGRYSGMIPTRAFEKVMPLDILPSPLFRALLVQDTDTAQALGCLELDEEDLALCAFVCPAKIDYGLALRTNLQRLEKEG
ncbi:MAG: Na(+)-translocating NADH-quinone reductase subunit A [Xanthomonadales bacterium]|nr:Na(+)-translocating NADH-quinone reductase subunit A [Gammaproteobacteria bacterium]MBT8051615.1 Na(+)-translocating NADH-quinone reductase subunit A [Gammaproteobacteria bacterium]MBT8055487.1 Na(+)-translocating NADH-quinone reductase subunit A [Gammaproteobacteria bacterium]NNJ77720.1 Na(+)-translocating NADH-quinone reductase subunit A [Xanthomonadales bacterium]NNL04923.1 Na(+)-translocating NADH-quinone reductase subunit A [Xanthomonadales bacterium]